MKMFAVFQIMWLHIIVHTSYATHYIDSDDAVKNLVKYKSNHEIFNMLVSYDRHWHRSIYFVEADIGSDGKRSDRGLYLWKAQKLTKLLDNGRDMICTSVNNERIFIGASDGLYLYKADKNRTERYGVIDDDIISLAIGEPSIGIRDVDPDIYIVTANKEVYRVIDNGNRKEKIDNIVNAEQIVLDSSRNIYFVSDDKQLYVRTIAGVKQVTGIKKNPSNIVLMKPTYMPYEIVAVVDDKTYTISADGTSRPYIYEFKYNPTAFANTISGAYYAQRHNIYLVDLTQFISITQ